MYQLIVEVSHNPNGETYAKKLQISYRTEPGITHNELEFQIAECLQEIVGLSSSIALAGVYHGCSRNRAIKKIIEGEE